MRDIDELISRSLKGYTTSDEERRLVEWRNAARGNDLYYVELVRLLRAVASSADRAAYMRRPTAADLIGAPNRSARTSRGIHGRGFSRWTAMITATAAMLTLALAGTYMAMRMGQQSFRMGAGEYVSGPNETTTATLADGTVVRLAPNSTLRIIDNPKRREVFLAGHAFLSVTHMADFPFLVRTDAGEVHVLGTRLDVRAGKDLRVVVVQGKVALSNGHDRVEIPAGEMSMVTDGALLQPVKIDVGPLVAWVGRFVAFQETTLREVVRELKRQYGATVVLEDSSMADLTVTGWYIDRTFEEIMVMICGVLDATCSVDNGIATISR